MYMYLYLQMYMYLLLYLYLPAPGEEPYPAHDEPLPLIAIALNQLPGWMSMTILYLYLYLHLHLYLYLYLYLYLLKIPQHWREHEHWTSPSYHHLSSLASWLILVLFSFVVENVFFWQNDERENEVLTKSFFYEWPLIFFLVNAALELASDSDSFQVIL